MERDLLHGVRIPRAAGPSPAHRFEYLGHRFGKKIASMLGRIAGRPPVPLGAPSLDLFPESLGTEGTKRGERWHRPVRRNGPSFRPRRAYAPGAWRSMLRSRPIAPCDQPFSTTVKPSARSPKSIQRTRRNGHPPGSPPERRDVLLYPRRAAAGPTDRNSGRVMRGLLSQFGCERSRDIEAVVESDRHHPLRAISHRS